METPLPGPATLGRPMPRVAATPTSTIMALAIALGLGGGYLDLVVMTYKKYFENDLKYYWRGSDSPWSGPVLHALLLEITGLLVAVVTCVLRRPLTLRAGSWLFATLAIWAALLRLPLYGDCTLLLAAGLARPISGPLATCYGRRRSARYACAGLLRLLLVLPTVSSGRQAVQRYGAVTDVPAPPAGARNVLLIVWDTVRAANLSLYGYPRDTTPNLQEMGADGSALPDGKAGASPLDLSLS